MKSGYDPETGTHYAPNNPAIIGGRLVFKYTDEQVCCPSFILARWTDRWPEVKKLINRKKLHFC